MQMRKLIAHGPSSLTVALPHKWIKKEELKKGDYIAIVQDDQGLHITPKPQHRIKAIRINLVGYDWPGTITTLTTLYRRGYDEITIRYKTPEEYQHISTAVRSLLGFATVENRKNVCKIKSLPSPLDQDFTTLFRRVFLILLQQLEDLADVLNSTSALKTFYHRDADMNAIVNLAVRMINKGFIQDRFQELHFFHALLMLEECGDDITRFTIEAQEMKNPTKLKTSVQHTSMMVRKLYEAYFKKNASILDFYKEYYLYWPDFEDKQPVKVLQHFKKQGPDVFYLRCIVEKVIQLAEILLLPKAEEL